MPWVVCMQYAIDGSKQHCDTAPLHMFVSLTTILPSALYCVRDWILVVQYLQLISNLNWMHGWVGLLVKGTLKVLTWHPLYEPFLDLTFRYGFTILWDFPLHNTCKKWWLWERSQGSQMCWDSSLFWFIPDTAHQTNGWRRTSMHKYGVLLVFWCWSGQ